MTLGATPKLKVLKASGEERTIDLENPRFTIGRSGDNHLQTNDPSVSRYHAEIVRQNGEFKLIDKESKCGTYVNGQRIQSCTLKHQDRIQLGNETQLVFLTHGEEVTTAPPVVDTPSMFISLAGSDLRNVSRLLETARMFSGGLPLGEVLDLVLDIAIEVTSAERAFLVLRDEEGQPRFQRGRDKAKQPLPEDAFQISHTILKQVMDSGERVLLSDVHGPQQFAASDSILNLELRTIVCLPLRKFSVLDSSAGFVPGAAVIGALYLDSKKAVDAFSRISQGILDSLAGDATAVIENARLLKESREKERLELELNTAREIQSAILPKIRGAYSFFDAYAQNIPSRHIGGDYYDLIKMPNDHYGFVIADVSGKGVSAAILCSMVQGILFAESQRHDSLADCVDSVNKYLVQRTSSNKFVTLFFGVLSPAGELRFVNAGHNPPYVIHPNGNLEELYSESVIVGAFDFATYKESCFRLKPGDLVCLYTDGVTEARNRKSEMLGEESFQKLLIQTRDQHVDEIVDNVFRVVAAHSSGEPQSDDISVFVLRYTAKEETLH